MHKAIRWVKRHSLNFALISGVLIFAACSEPVSPGDSEIAPIFSPTPEEESQVITAATPSAIPVPTSTPTPSPTLIPSPTATATPVPPSASFSVDLKSGDAPLIVEFSNSSRGPFSSVEWDFGDGGKSTVQSPSHLYTKAGTHRVTLKIFGPGGDLTSAFADTVTVKAGLPVSLTIGPPYVKLPVQGTIQFTAVAVDEFGNLVDGTLEWHADSKSGDIDNDGTLIAGTQAGVFDGAVTVSFDSLLASLTGTAIVEIEPGPIAVVDLRPSIAILAIGDRRLFTLEVMDEHGNSIRDPFVLWETIEGAGTIDANGAFTAGTAAGSYSEAIDVKVVKGTSRGSASAHVSIKPDSLVTVRLVPDNVTIDTGLRRQFTATGFDDHGNEIPDLAFIWRVTGGRVTQDGLFTAGSHADIHELEVIASHGTSVRSASTSIEISPWAWWPGDRDANDAAGDNNGKFRGGATTAPGIIGDAFSFDNGDDLVEVADAPSLNITDSITIAAWFKMSAPTNWGMIVIKEPGPPHPGYALIVNDRLRVHCEIIKEDPEIAGYISAHTPIEVDEWYHGACVYDGSSTKVYVNGEMEGVEEYRGGIGANDVPLRIGDNFRGLIDEVRVYPRALSDEELKAIYEEGAPVS